jgi:hypothetical protein
VSKPDDIHSGMCNGLGCTIYRCSSQKITSFLGWIGVILFYLNYYARFNASLQTHTPANAGGIFLRMKTTSGAGGFYHVG